MTDDYYLDLEGFSLERFRQTLESGNLLPSRRILKDEIPERFAILESLGIRNLQNLIEALKTKKRLENFARQSGLPMDYLVNLRREANSYLPKPMDLAVIPGVDLGHRKQGVRPTCSPGEDERRSAGRESSNQRPRVLPSSCG